MTKFQRRFTIGFSIILLAVLVVTAISLGSMNADAAADYTGAPQITVLTHGLGGSASHWSNENGSGNKGFTQDIDSLVYKLSEKAGGAYIYRAYTFGGINNPDYVLYRDYGESIANIENISKHIIVVFETVNNSESNNVVYAEFKHMLNDVINTVKNLNRGNQKPKVNLIGHSRGGITNLQYALDHPENVHSLISIGTPYFGSEAAKEFGSLIIQDSNGLKDIINDDIYLEYYNRWNAYYDSRYKDINSIAIGGVTTVDYQCDVLNASNGTYAEALSTLLTYFNNAIMQGISVTVMKNNYSSLVKSYPMLEKFGEEKFKQLVTLLDNEIHYGKWYSDVLVPVDSQQGFSGEKNYYFTKYVKEFSKVNETMPPKLATDSIAVIHNLETYDDDIHQYILKNIIMQSGDVIDNEISNVGKIKVGNGLRDYKWQIKIRNTHNEQRTYAYNSKMCFWEDAQNWKGLVDVKFLKIDAGKTAIIEIEPYGTATSIAVSSVFGNTRYIKYADKLWFESNILYDDIIYKMTSYDSSKPYYSYIEHGIKVSISDKVGMDWYIELTNNTGEARKLSYNSKMCFFDHAKNWDSIIDIKETDILENGETVQVSIREYLAATSITFSYNIGIDRYIFYANELDDETKTMTSYANKKPTYYTQYGMKVAIVDKDGDTWTLQLTNNTGGDKTFGFNNRMCFFDDAKNWSGISDFDYVFIKNGMSSEIKIREYGTATSITISYSVNIDRYIFYANELDVGTGTMVSYANKKPTYYNQYGLKVGIVGKNDSKWILQLTNNTGSDRIITYNKKMCFESDAKTWVGLSDLENVLITNKATREITISEYGTATSIAISYKIDLDRYIFYAKNLDSKTATMTSYGNIIRPTYYTRNGITVAISEKNNDTWTLQLTNNTGSTRTFEYNNTMCFKGDAQNWRGLSNVSVVNLTKGASSLINIREYGTATSIAISYMDGVYRKIFYANELSAKTATMTAMENTIDTSASSDSCIAAGTLITLADGRQVPVETLSGKEKLLVWNMETGAFDAAPIVFIDSEPTAYYEVIRLSFSDGTVTDVISEHGFYDTDLNRYVYLDANAAQYIGHGFIKQTTYADGSFGQTRVVLTGVEICTEMTAAYSPVTYGHLCYYVNGMLSMPGGIAGLFDIFEVDARTMSIDAEKFAADIAQYGTFTYEEFAETYPVSEEVFEAFNGRYLKVAIGKGLITVERIGELIERYSVFF